MVDGAVSCSPESLLIAFSRPNFPNQCGNISYFTLWSWLRDWGSRFLFVTYFPKAGWEAGFCFGLEKTQHLLSEPIYVGPGFHAEKEEGGYSSRQTRAGFPDCFILLHKHVPKFTYQSKPSPHHIPGDRTPGPVPQSSNAQTEPWKLHQGYWRRRGGFLGCFYVIDRQKGSLLTICMSQKLA